MKLKNCMMFKVNKHKGLSNIKLSIVFSDRMQAWFNGRTSASQAEDAGSIPVAC